ncbi:hypothetical protein ACS127_10425 [Amphibacillus sp. Q70]|uniref:hypothetical protein n=1 Tax=Amphibacillus sp. Q70 TaxID=3453416 RepID=UPI003F8472D8
MKQDVNKILDIVSTEWAGTQAQANKKVAVLTEQVERLQSEISRLNQEVDELKGESSKEEQ